MSENPRDTQFMGFAKSIWDEIATTLEALEAEHEIVDGCLMCNWTPEKIAQVVEPLIARRAYDLACHVINHVSQVDAEFREGGLQEAQDIADDIPDLTELPTEE